MIRILNDDRVSENSQWEILYDGKRVVVMDYSGEIGDDLNDSVQFDEVLDKKCLHY